jgi:hypothetical protein
LETAILLEASAMSGTAVIRQRRASVMTDALLRLMASRGKHHTACRPIYERKRTLSFTMTRVGRRREGTMAEAEKRYPHRFAEVVEAVAKEPGVTFGQPGARKTFGHSALKVNEKIFAMVPAKEDFVVKLPKQRVDELEAAGAGKRFKAVNGSPMKEWSGWQLMPAPTRTGLSSRVKLCAL